MADEHGVAGGPHDHAQHRQPDVRHALGCLLPVADAEHVAHRLEEGKGVQLAPGVILQQQGQRRHSVLAGAQLLAHACVHTCACACVCTGTRGYNALTQAWRMIQVLCLHLPTALSHRIFLCVFDSLTVQVRSKQTQAPGTAGAAAIPHRSAPSRQVSAPHRPPGFAFGSQSFYFF